MSKLILFTGDSITNTSLKQDSFVDMGKGYARLVKSSFGLDRHGEFTFLNRGISGNRSVDLYARIESDMINLKPDYVSILIGINDVLHRLGTRNTGISAGKYEMIYDLIISELKDALPNTKAMIIEPFILPGSGTEGTEDCPDRWERLSREVPVRQRATRRIAQKHGVLFVPLQEIFNEACKLEPAEYWLHDGVHPSPAGHELIKRQWIK